MAMVAAFDLDPRQYDVLKSYYHARLDQRVYCHPPDGMGVDGDKLLVKVWIEGGSLDPDRMLRSERKKWISTCHPLCRWCRRGCHAGSRRRARATDRRFFIFLDRGRDTRAS